MKRLIACFAVILALLTAIPSYAGTVSGQGWGQGDAATLLEELVYSSNFGTLSDMGVSYATKYIVITTGDAYNFNGSVYTSIASNTLTFSAGHTALTASQQCVFIVGLTATGAVGTTQSRIVASSADEPTPVFSTSYAPIGKIKVVTAATGAFTPNTTNLNDASCTITISDYKYKPISMTIPD